MSSRIRSKASSGGGKKRQAVPDRERQASEIRREPEERFVLVEGKRHRPVGQQTVLGPGIVVLKETLYAQQSKAREGPLADEEIKEKPRDRKRRGDEKPRKGRSRRVAREHHAHPHEEDHHELGEHEEIRPKVPFRRLHDLSEG